MSIALLLAALFFSPTSSRSEPELDPVRSPDPIEDATDLSNRQRPREAASYAMAAFARTDLAPDKRIELALFAQSEYAWLYGLSEGDPPGDPVYLCRALDILDLALPLVATDDERRRFERWYAAHRSALKADYPAHRCSLVAREVTPSPPPSPAPPDPAPAAAPSTTSEPRVPMPPEDPTPRRLQIAGAVLVPLGLLALGVLGAVASGYRRDVARADALHEELAARPWTADDRTRMRELLATTRREEGQIVALGLTGAALVAAGAALLVRGGLQRRRVRPGLDLQRHGVGLTISGGF